MSASLPSIVNIRIEFNTEEVRSLLKRQLIYKKINMIKNIHKRDNNCMFPERIMKSIVAG